MGDFPGFGLDAGSQKDNRGKQNDHAGKTLHFHWQAPFDFNWVGD